MYFYLSLVVTYIRQIAVHSPLCLCRMVIVSHNRAKIVKLRWRICSRNRRFAPKLRDHRRRGSRHLLSLTRVSQYARRPTARPAIFPLSTPTLPLLPFTICPSVILVVYSSSLPSASLAVRAVSMLIRWFFHVFSSTVMDAPSMFFKRVSCFSRSSVVLPFIFSM